MIFETKKKNCRNLSKFLLKNKALETRRFCLNLNYMTTKKLLNGTVHKVPPDLRKVLFSGRKVMSAWEAITPLARNEWICWVISVKKSETRLEHIERVRAELLGGKRRPCCWIGCIHRTDKPVYAGNSLPR